MAISVTPASSQRINPSKHVVVTATQGTLSTVSVTNSKRGSTASGGFSENRTKWESNEVLAFGATYAVVAKGVGTDGRPVIEKSTVSTIDPAKTSYTNTIPPQGGTTEGIGIGQPIVVRFNYPVQNKAEVQQHLRVTSSPPQPGAWYWIDSKNVHY
ncbi:MAG: Ig-like domain-containing protein, partial [Sciscionella sp.]